MRIGANIPSLLAYNNMRKAYDNVSLSSLRMSSGFRINSAGDDAAGLAIATKINQQVKGLEQASRNSSNAISFIQTADGALSAIHDMIQRVRELAVQAANDTYEPDDRQKMQDEIDQLIDEINSIPLKTEYNKIKLINGECDRIMRASGPSGVNGMDIDVLRISDSTPYGDMQFMLNAAATQAEYTTLDLAGAFTMQPDPYLKDHTITITIDDGTSNYTFTTDPIEDTDDRDSLLQKINDALAGSGFTANPPDSGSGIIGSITPDTPRPGFTVNITVDALGTDPDANLVAELNEKLGFVGTATTGTDIYGPVFMANTVSHDPFNSIVGRAININGQSVVIDAFDDANSLAAKIKQAAVNAGLEVIPGTGNNIVDGFKSMDAGSDQEINITGDAYTLRRLGLLEDTYTPGEDAKITVDNTATNIFTTNYTWSAQGNRVTFADVGGVEICLDLTNPLNNGVYTLTTKPGPLMIQVGPNKDMSMYMTIPRVNAKTIEIDKADVSNWQKATNSIDIADKSLAIVSEVRARLGAYQNRLEYTVTNLDNSFENASKSLSVIKDTDMAAEMTEYAKYNVMYQAGISILTQSNARPQAVLQLLQ